MVSRQATSEYAKKASRAVGRVQAAIRSGRLVRQPCVDCGADKVEAHHHNGYDREHALDVTWLCRTHHMARHGKSNRPAWERGMRAYMARTRPGLSHREPYHQFSAWSGPKRLFWVIERAWSYLRTDEERAWALALVERLAKGEEQA